MAEKRAGDGTPRRSKPTPAAVSGPRSGWTRNTDSEPHAPSGQPERDPVAELIRRSPWISHHRGNECMYCGEHFLVDLHSDDCAWADAEQCWEEIEHGHMEDVEIISGVCSTIDTKLSRLVVALAKEYPWRWTSDRGNVCRYCGSNDEHPQDHAQDCVWMEARQATMGSGRRGAAGADRDAG